MIARSVPVLNPLNANPTKLSNTLKQFVGNLPTNCLSVFDHFMKLALKGLSYQKNVLFLLLGIYLFVTKKLRVFAENIGIKVSALPTTFYCYSATNSITNLSNK